MPSIPATARSIFVDNLRGVDLDGGNALASSGGFVMPNFFFQANWGVTGTRYRYGMRFKLDIRNGGVLNNCKWLLSVAIFEQVVISSQSIRTAHLPNVPSHRGQGARDIFSNVRQDAAAWPHGSVCPSVGVSGHVGLLGRSAVRGAVHTTIQGDGARFQWQNRLLGIFLILLRLKLSGNALRDMAIL